MPRLHSMVLRSAVVGMGAFGVLFASLLFASLLFGFQAAEQPGNTKAHGEPQFDDAALEFFEKQVRPILVQRCYECHSDGPKGVKGGLRLDSRAAAIKGGDTGPAVVPGKLQQSLLIDAINYGDTYQMPPKSKLPAAEIALLTKWVQMGAPWPATKVEQKVEKAFDLVLQERKAVHWCWQPVKVGPLPAVKTAGWVRDPLDRFILEKLEAAGISPAPPAEKRTLLRRVYFDLIGLPPSPAEVEEFVQDRSPDAYAKVVDKLLASPHFGERWARHWMDLVRYAESRGHEFEPIIPNAWQYRDYLIRAFNADVPYDRFVTEHIAGDLLASPRRHPEKGFNESILGTGFWFLGEEVHSPVDIRQDEADRLDNRLDVMTKTFLGMAVSCARCHDHKFDAISQKDYYALQGYLLSSCYRQARFETVEQEKALAEKLAQLRTRSQTELLAKLAQAEQPVAQQTAAYLLAARAILLDGVDWGTGGDATGEVVFEDFEHGSYKNWDVTGTAFGDEPVTQATIAPYQGNVKAQGKFFVNSHNVRGGTPAVGDPAIGTLTSPEFMIGHDYITLLVGGGSHPGQTCVNLVIDGKVVHSATGKNNNEMSQVVWDARPYRGKTARIQAMDEVKGKWGNIGFDHIVFTNRSPSGTPTVLTVDQLSPATRAKIAALAQAGILTGFTRVPTKLDPQVLAKWVVELHLAKTDASHLWHPFALLTLDKSADDADKFALRWRDFVTKHIPASAPELPASPPGRKVVVDYASFDKWPAWAQDGVAYGDRPVRVGDVRWGNDPARAIAGFADVSGAEHDRFWQPLRARGGVQRDHGTLGAWDRAGRTLRTPDVLLGSKQLWYLVRGSGRAYAVVDSHLIIAGPLHGALLKEWKGDPHRWQWVPHGLAAYQGHRLHVEFSPTGDNSPLMVAQVVDADQPPPFPSDKQPAAGPASVARLLASTAVTTDITITTVAKLASIYQAVVQDVLLHLQRDTLSGRNEQARNEPTRDERARDAVRVADFLVQQVDLFTPSDSSAKADYLQTAAQFVQQQAELARQIPAESLTAPAMLDGSGSDEFLLIRGNSRTPGPVVPRRFLTALGGEQRPAVTQGSGRLDLAAQINHPANPLTQRVIVNRLWQHLFGTGIVPTVDNFGVLGQPPSHLALLDQLTHDFVQDGQSLKRMIRRLVLSQTYQMSSKPTAAGTKLDPENRLWHRMPIRRLEGEAIRDMILANSGRLDRTPFGPSTPVHLTPFMTGRGRPEVGPLDGNGRRSVYISVRRNFLSPMMLAFDTPIPFSTMGRRNSSNVPAQALILMNDPFVVQQADVWAKRLLADKTKSTLPDRLRDLYLTAFARLPSDIEVQEAQAFLQQQVQEHTGASSPTFENVQAWGDYIHVLMNSKEYIFIN